MKVKITKPVLVQGNPAQPGDVVDIPPADAANVIGAGRGVRYTEPEPKPKAQPEEVETTAVEPNYEKAVKKRVTRKRSKAKAGGD